MYVAPWGSDGNPGTQDRPLQTVALGLRRVRPGGTLLLRGGSYAERITNARLTPGTSSTPVTVSAFPGEQPVIEGLFYLHNASYWTVSGITVIWSPRNSRSEHMVKMVGGTGWTLTDNTFTGARSYSALLITRGAQHWTVSNNTITHTEQANGINQDHLIYVNGAGAGTIERNLLTDSPNGRAVKVMDVQSGLAIRHNTMHRNTGPSNVQLTGTCRDVEISGNIMTDSRPRYPAVTVHGYQGSGNTVTDNLVWNVSGALPRGVTGLSDGGGNATAAPTLALSRQFGVSAAG